MQRQKELRPQPKPLQAIQCACTNLKMAARTVGRAYDAALAPAGMNATQYAILINTRRYQPISQMRLAAHLGLERTTLYRAIEILEGNGWLTATSTRAGVTKVLTLTPRGVQVTAQAQRAWERVQQDFLHAFGAERWASFLGMLDEFRQHFRAGSHAEGTTRGRPSADAPHPSATRRRQE
jgi:DNA-binding MarR family transcriptional regulator